MFRLIRHYPALLIFGILTAAFSSPGQTFLVSLFIPHFRELFDLTKTQIAAYYSAATFLSALLLPVLGRILDRVPLMIMTVTVGILLAIGCLILSQATIIPWMFLGFFLIRNMGQGAVTLVSMTTMARIFGPMRGKALGIANLGYPIGEALFPVMVVGWMNVHGWRGGWEFLSACVAFVFVPAVIILLKNDPHKRAQKKIAEETDRSMQEAGITENIRHWTVREMFRDSRFYLVQLPLYVPAFYFTALFFHQHSFMEWKGWGIHLISMGFIAFGVMRALVSFLIGPYIDKYSAQQLFPYTLLPLFAGLLCFLLGGDGIWVYAYLGFCGMTMGLSMTIGGALYAEFYGTKELGAIRGVKGALMVFCTALAPVLMGLLLDTNISISAILMGMLSLIVLAMILAWIGCTRPIPKI